MFRRLNFGPDFSPGTGTNARAIETSGPQTAAPRRIPLYAPSLITSQLEFPVAIGAVGAIVMYDPTGASYRCTVEVAPELRSSSPRFFTLPPFGPVDFRPNGFENLILRVTVMYDATLGIPAGTFLGALVVSTQFYQDSSGLLPQSALWVRDVPSTLTTRTVAGAAWTAVGALGIFSYRHQLTPDLSGQITSVEHLVKNAGSGPIYLGAGDAIAVDNSTNRAAVMTLESDEETTIVLSGIPADPVTTTPTAALAFVYCEDPTSAILTGWSRAYR